MYCYLVEISDLTETSLSTIISVRCKVFVGWLVVCLFDWAVFSIAHSGSDRHVGHVQVQQCDINNNNNNVS